MANHLLLPLISPLLGAALATLFGRFRPLARALVLLSVLTNLGYGLYLLDATRSGPLISQAGNWIAPFGISLVADGMSALMIALAALLMLMTLIYSWFTIEAAYERYLYYPLLLLLLFGVSGAFLTGDLFNLYVWFEVLLMASFGLITLGGTRGQLEGGLKYMLLNLIGSTAFLIGAGLIYGVAGTLNMAHLAERLATVPNHPLLTAIAGLFLFAFGSKAGIAPLFFWLPGSYHTPPVAVTAIFSGLMTKVGVYALYRTFGLIMPDALAFYSPLIMVIAAATMLIGVFGAMAQMQIRRILGFHIVSQIGYSIMGLALASAAGFGAGLLFTAHVMIVKTALFFIGGVAEYQFGHDDLKKAGGLARREPLLAIGWFLGILSLAGIPPLSGFFGKLALLQVGIEQQAYWLTGIAAGTSILTFFSMLKIWNEVFWKKAYRSLDRLPRAQPGRMLPGLALVMLSLALGIGAGPLVDYAFNAGEQLVSRAAYITAVCGEAGCEAVTQAELQRGGSQ